MMKPWQAPKPAPNTSISAAEASGCQPKPSSLAITTPTKPIIEPIERSMPPERMTKLAPIAAMMRNALSSRMSPSTKLDRKWLYMWPPTPNNTTKTAIVAASGR